MPGANQTINTERVRTEIPGFDELCGGGLLKKRTYLVSGVSGSGKTIFGLQYLYNGITKYGEPGIYISIDEAPSMVRENVIPFGWDLKTLEDEGKFAIIDARSIKSGKTSNEKSLDIEHLNLRSLIETFLVKQEELSAKRVLVGGAASIGFSLKEHSNINLELMKLCKTLEILGLTALITCETTDDSTATRFGVETSVTQGTILMSQKRMDSMRVRSIEIIRMKGSTHSQAIHPFEISRDGIVVHPNEEIYSS